MPTPTIRTLLFALSALCCVSAHTTLQLPTVHIEEQLEPHTQLANLTDLITAALLTHNLTAQVLPLHSLTLLTKSRYFTVDSKQISVDTFIIRHFELLTIVIMHLHRLACVAA